MEFRTEIRLKGMVWDSLVQRTENIFGQNNRPFNYNIFYLSLAIGIMYDKRIEKFEDGEIIHNVPRNVLFLRNNDGRFDFIYQAAILTSNTIDFDEETRLELAFGENSDSSEKMDFLLGFANFGATILLEKLGSNDLETMDNLKNFLVSTLEGRNFDIDNLSDEDLLSDWVPDFTE